MDSNSKDLAFQFLRSLEHRLSQRLPAWLELHEAVPEIVAEAKMREDWGNKRQPEDAFLYHFAFPIVFEYLANEMALGRDKARESLLCEYHKFMPDLVSGTPTRPIRFGIPFGKEIESTESINTRWRNEAVTAKTQQPCPDFAIRAPSPHKVVFEGKYFSSGTLAAAENHLVQSSYQAFFYRSLPPSEANYQGISWEYDYACLLACDASEEGNLLEAWRTLDEGVRNDFWSGSSVYVMIVRPSG